MYVYTVAAEGSGQRGNVPTLFGVAIISPCYVKSGLPYSTILMPPMSPQFPRSLHAHNMHIKYKPIRCETLICTTRCAFLHAIILCTFVRCVCFPVILPKLPKTTCIPGTICKFQHAFVPHAWPTYLFLLIGVSRGLAKKDGVHYFFICGEDHVPVYLLWVMIHSVRLFCLCIHTFSCPGNSVVVVVKIGPGPGRESGGRKVGSAQGRERTRSITRCGPSWMDGRTSSRTMKRRRKIISCLVFITVGNEERG